MFNRKTYVLAVGLLVLMGSIISGGLYNYASAAGCPCGEDCSCPDGECTCNAACACADCACGDACKCAEGACCCGDACTCKASSCAAKCCVKDAVKATCCVR